MSYDRLARSYLTLERLSFGGRLQACRVAGLSWIRSPQEVLLLGEGNGRFLTEMVQAFPEARVHVVDASSAMLAQARKRVGRRFPAALDRIRFEQGRVPDIQLPTGCYDLVVTNFFLDCFDARGLDSILPYLDRCLRDEAHWLYADFCMPSAGWRRLRSQVWLATMYRFFGMVADLEARALVDPLPRLRELGWDCHTSVSMDRDFLVAALLQRRGRSTGLTNAIHDPGS